MNNLTAFDPAKFSAKVVKNLDQINIALPRTNRDYEGDLTENSTVYVRTLGSITMGAYTKGNSIAYGDLAPAREAFTVSDAQYFAFLVDDIDVRQNDLNALDLYAKRAAVAMSNTVEAKILGQYTNAHVDNQITGASSAAIALTASNVYAQFVQARAALSKKNVPAIGRWAIVDPDTVSALLQSPQFTRSTAQGDEVVANGIIGRIAGFDVYESNAVPVASGAKYILFGDDLAIAYAGQITEIEMIRLPDKFATACRGLLLHDAHVFAENSKRLGYVKAVA